MDLSLENGPLLPPVEVLVARVVGESAEGDEGSETRLKATFVKYAELEDAAFTLFKQDRRDYLLHFHLESHDRCDVRLKPLLWDKGTYFRLALPSDGALRLIPHFMPIVLRVGVARKLQLPPPALSDTIVATFRPQEKRIEVVEDSTSPVAVETTEHVLTAEVDGLAERESHANKPVRHQPKKCKESKRKKIFKSDVTSALPRDATYSNYSLEYNAARDTHLAAKRNKYPPPEKAGWLQQANIDAHCEMVGGRYGMTSVVPCGHCVAAGTVCRVYHQECYEWDGSRSSSIKQDLGWRCERCRRTNNRTVAGGCDARPEK